MRRKVAVLSQVGTGRPQAVAVFLRQPLTSHSLSRMVVSRERLCPHMGLRSHAGAMDYSTKETINVRLKTSKRQLNTSGQKKQAARLRLSDPNLGKRPHCRGETPQRQRGHRLSRLRHRTLIHQCHRRHTPTSL